MDVEPLPAHAPPLVSVIIPTYNYSSVLKYAIQSVLWQTVQDFELWVIGDACTDDSEVVVRSFGDPRIHWHNLPENTGNQSIPNNTGIQQSRGKYIAYLGHDDLWYPTHLETLVNALEASGADAAHSLSMAVLPGEPRRRLYGISGSGRYEPTLLVPTVSLMHLRAMVDDVGYWKNYRTIRISADIEFITRAAHLGKRFLSVMALTVFLFPASARKNVYLEKPEHEQAVYAERIQHAPDFLYRELLACISDSSELRRAFALTFDMPSMAQPGALVEQLRLFRGLAPKPALEETPLLEDFFSLINFNLPEDITPETSSQFLHAHKALPTNGVLIGTGWYGFERDAQGQPFRWVNTDAELLLTELDPHPWRLTMNLWPGYANDGLPVTVALVGPDGAIVDRLLLEEKTRASFSVTPPTAGTVTYSLRVLDSQNKPLPSDPRILNIGVSGLELEDAREGSAEAT